MDRKIVCLALGTVLFALSFQAGAQQPKKILRIGLHSCALWPSARSVKPTSDCLF